MNNYKPTDRQNKIFRECLNAVVNGPFIPTWEFSILIGLQRDEVDCILKEWPRIDIKDPKVQIAVNNALNNLTGYPINAPEQWDAFLSISKEELYQVYNEWKAS